ncbi:MULTISPECIES: hypothetical protein [unclassified Cupriavidus]|uniref:hypothetical protein n=1 Tax=unclassified Cupriavidus TaxID=2640874 RepID=UPI0012EAB637|nr:MULTISPECIES: hypothetical protein [unclassified Cupriavidus]
MLAQARRAVAAVAHIGQEDVGTGHRAADHLGGVGRLDRDHVGAAFGQHRRRWRRRGLVIDHRGLSRPGLHGTRAGAI